MVNLQSLDTEVKCRILTVMRMMVSMRVCSSRMASCLKGCIWYLLFQLFIPLMSSMMLARRMLLIIILSTTYVLAADRAPFFSSHCLIPTLGDQGETYRQITCGYSFDSERGYICLEYVYWQCHFHQIILDACHSGTGAGKSKFRLCSLRFH